MSMIGLRLSIMRAYIALLLLAASLIVSIADASERIPLATGPDLQMPSLWRVLLAFLLAGTMAFVVTLLLRRLKPWLNAKGIAGSSSNIAIVAHRKLERTLSLYVVDVEKQRFLIAHSAHSTEVSKLELPISDQDIPTISTQNMRQTL